jgi:3-deoxy-D-manno-octulosonic-acid transferase
LKIFYNLFIKLYPIAAQLLSSKNPKAKHWVNGRKNIFIRLQKAFEANTQPVIWMHCSSLGEFEQGRPVIEQLKQQYQQHKILVTFFSPSGYEIHQNYRGADWVFYLPMDSAKNALQFFDVVRPQLILFVKYEYWFYYLQEAKKRNIPLLLIAGIFRKDQPFFKWYGNFYRSMLPCFTHFFVQTEASKKLLQSIGFKQNITVAGDTRFDRVIEIAQQTIELLPIDLFIQNHTVLIAGSTWAEDDLELSHFIRSHESIKCIIAPHDIGNERIKQCLELYKNAILWSEWIKVASPNTHFQCIIIDNIGLLSKLYKYATIAYVGGGFGNDGVHNVLEAAVYSKPVIFGPEYEKYIEAIELIEVGAAWSIDSAITLEENLATLLDNPIEYEKACTSAGNYVQSKSGATKKVLEYIYENRLLTN